ncbi:MAG: host attachment protein [Sphingomonadales bacterium]|nr:host attachment protein [Sphingomonadales bacterium]
MQIANGTLILVVDGAKMLIFRNEGDEKYAVLSTLEHEETLNPRTSDQGSDAPGRSFSSMDNRRSAYGDTDWHHQAQEKFAVGAAEKLRHVAQSETGSVVVIAPPRMLGTLRRHYGAAVEQRVIAEIAKDLAGHVTEDISRAIAAYGA